MQTIYGQELAACARASLMLHFTWCIHWRRPGGTAAPCVCPPAIFTRPLFPSTDYTCQNSKAKFYDRLFFAKQNHKLRGMFRRNSLLKKLLLPQYLYTSHIYVAHFQVLNKINLYIFIIYKEKYKLKRAKGTDSQINYSCKKKSKE